jgi:vacuolar-type H+-ATPase subunit E/Vma4
MQHLDEADMEHQRFLEEAGAEEARKLLEANQGRIDELQAESDRLDGLRGDLQAAKALFEQYNPATEGERPADWTQEKA